MAPQKGSLHPPGDGASILLVQCCHLPQFLFAAETLQRRFPNMRMDALVSSHRHVEDALQNSPLFGKVMFGSLRDGGRYDAIVLPLLNRGYHRLKRLAWMRPEPKWEVDYDAVFTELAAGAVWLSILTPRHPVNAAFAEYSAAFRPRPLEGDILLAASCSSECEDEMRPVWEPLLPPNAAVTRIDSETADTPRPLTRHSFQSAIVFLSGQEGFARLKMLPFLLRIPRILAITETGHCFEARPTGLLRFWYQRFRYGVIRPRPGPTTLLVQTEGHATMRHAIDGLKRPSLYPDGKVWILCKEENRSEYESNPEVDRVFSLEKGRWKENLATLRSIRTLSPDYLSAIFSGRRIFLKHKLAWLLLADRPKLVFNAAVDCYWLGPSTLPRLLRKEPLLFEEDSEDGQPVLFVQSEDVRLVEDALGRMVRHDLYPDSPVVVLCREQDRARLRDLPGVVQTLPFPTGSWKEWLDLARTMRRLRPRHVCLVFSGRPVFSFHKLLTLLLFPLRPKLVFNASLDAYWLTPRTASRIFLSEPLPYGLEQRQMEETLLVQTESRQLTARILEKLIAADPVRSSHITLLCRQDDRDYFSSRAPQVEIHTFASGLAPSQLRRLSKILFRRWDMVAGIATGLPTFRGPRVAFLWTPARERLCFNENTDAYFLRRGRLSRALFLPSLTSGRPVRRAPAGWLRRTVRGLLFLPRFVYLLGWVGMMRLVGPRR